MTKPKPLADHYIVVLKLPKSNAESLKQIKLIYGGLSDIKKFPVWVTTSVTMVDFKTDLDEYDKAELGAGQNPPTFTIEQRNILREKVLTNLEFCRLGVQALVRATPAKAADIAASACMALKGNPTSSKRKNIAKRNKDLSGWIIIGDGTGFTDWRRSTDEENWEPMPPTRKCKKSIDNLKRGENCYIQSRAVLINEEYGSWGPSIKIEN